MIQCIITNYIRPSLSILFLLTILLGFIYPSLITLIAKTIFPFEANGSLIKNHGQIVGSALIGQDFSDPKYFWGRLSATTPPYNSTASSGSNLGPNNPELIKRVKDRIAELKKYDSNNNLPIPIDLVTSSASGLDPHISILAAEYQVSRIAKTRKIREQILKDMILNNITDRQLFILGEPTVNVLKLNIELDEVDKIKKQ